MITMIDTRFVTTEIPGYCYRRAKFRRVGTTRINALPVLQLAERRMPPPAVVPYTQLTFDELYASPSGSFATS